jgi:hypothetical protein
MANLLKLTETLLNRVELLLHDTITSNTAATTAATSVDSSCNMHYCSTPHTAVPIVHSCCYSVIQQHTIHWLLLLAPIHTALGGRNVSVQSAFAEISEQAVRYSSVATVMADMY